MSRKYMLVLLVAMVMASTTLANRPKFPPKPIPPSLQEQRQTPHVDNYNHYPKPPHNLPDVGITKNLSLGSNKISDNSSHGDTVTIKELSLKSNKISDNFSHGNAATTKELSLKSNKISDNSSHENAVTTKELSLKNNKISDNSSHGNVAAKELHIDNYIHKPPLNPPHVGTTKELPQNEHHSAKYNNSNNPGHGGGNGAAKEPNNFLPRPPFIPPTTN